MSDNEKMLWQYIQRLFKKKKILVENITGVVISSVAPKRTAGYLEFSKKYLHVAPIVISGSLPVGINIRYKKPSSLGADRLCSAIAAYKKYGGPAIAIDAGTAITFDVISKRGDYLGGAIMPGLQTSAIALQIRTAKLPNVKLIFPKSVLGTSTEECMQSGILYGTAGAIEKIVQRIKKKTGSKTNVVITGGDARILFPKCPSIDYVEPNLVLRGARIIYEKIQQL